jgi:hypothetical protein
MRATMIPGVKRMPVRLGRYFFAPYLSAAKLTGEVRKDLDVEAAGEWFARILFSLFSPKLLWVRWGFFGFDLLVCCFWVVWCLTTLLGGDGEWDGGVDEVEGAVLGAGGLGEFVDLDVGVLVADLIAGQGR